MPDRQLPPDEDAVLQVALAIADRTPVDWAALTSSSDLPDRCVPSLAQLDRVVAGHQAFLRTYDCEDTTPLDTLLTEARQEAETDGLLQVAWGPLVVREKVGHGAFGDVYRAWDPKLEREVALKLVPATTTTSFPSVYDEGRKLARVRHPNVVAVYGVERVRGRVGLWMEYIDGPTLADEVATRGPFDPLKAARVGLAVCRALSAVHETGLLHRDVKAQNVMRDSDGRVVLGDFGTGRQLEDGSVPTHQLAGTPLYLAPEVLAWKPATAASDQYSVGVLLYFLVTGEYPVDGDTVAEVRRAHEDGKRITLARRLPDAPPALLAAVDRALDPEPSRRHENVTALGQALETVVDAGIDGVGVGPGPGQRSIDTRRWLAGALAVGLVSVAVGMFRPGTDSTGNQSSALAPTVRRISAGMIPMTPLTHDARYFGCIDRETGDLALCDLFEDDYRQVRRITSRTASGDTASYRWGAFSPDGLEVAYVAEQPSARLEGPQEIRIIGVDGAAERVISREFDGVKAVWVHSWTERGEILVHLLFPDTTTELVVVSVADGSLRSIRKAGPGGFGAFERSPGGRYLFHSAAVQDMARPALSLLDLQSGREAMLLEGRDYDSGAVWLPDGSGILFNRARGDTMGLWRLEIRDGFARGEPTFVGDMGRHRLHPRGFASDGSLYYSIEVDPWEVFVGTPEPGPDRPLDTTRVSARLTAESHSPAWSDDGRYLAYVSRLRTGQGTIVRDTSTGEEQSFPLEPLDVFGSIRPRWLPDRSGLGLLVLSMVEYTNELRVIDPHTGERLRQLSLGSIEEYGEIYDYDWLTEDTVVFLRRGRVVTLDVETGIEHPAYANDGEPVTSMALSPDRTLVALLIRADEMRSVGVMPATGGEVAVVHQAQPQFVLPMELHDWSADGRSLFFSRRDTATIASNPRVRLWRVELDGGDPLPLNVADEGLAGVDVHPNGHDIAFRAGARRGETWVIENVLRGMNE